jgi:thioredoxin reductase (NADPH)
LDYDLGIIGAGPAGMSAALYGNRAGLDVVLIDMAFGGGTVTINPIVENYLGMGSLKGSELAAKMREHVEKYVKITTNEPVSKLEVGKEKVNIITDKRTLEVGAIILATGTEYRKLGIPGEGKFLGRGVSYCATCDGPFFRNKKIVVVGGGNSAAVEALYLKGVTDKISLIHRRDILRAENFYVNQLKKKGVELLLNSEVQEIYGDSVVKGIVLANKDDKASTEFPIEGVFISIGTIPRSELAKGIGVKLDDHGHILVDKSMKTNIDRVYATGDVIGGIRQIVTAVSGGAVAALSSLSVLGKQYPFY